MFVDAILLAGEKLNCPAINMYEESGITEKAPDKETEENIQETDPEIHEEAKAQPWYITVLLSLLFSLPCIAVAGYVIYRYLKNRRE